ncbi:hypothetical protein UFOVP836_26 [uncultured Caudovirales phage]|uniref:Uncharacterized protein n=1 Tax=uncultured Caudovirales phage TaxID=2100421 RepID=A0A6J5P3C4_9CAUD|nr:hypothetical protein UFOVP836_26 [uncultured Caudovirales phage]
MTILDQLKRAGAVLVRQKNHQVWRLPDGRRYVMSQTPSDGRAGRNQAAVLRRLLKTK